VEQIAHGIDEDHPRFVPAQRISEFLWDQPEIESPFVGMALDATEPLSEGLGITVLAPRADLRAATDRIPRRIRPFNCRVIAHRSLDSIYLNRTRSRPLMPLCLEVTRVTVTSFPSSFLITAR